METILNSNRKTVRLAASIFFFLGMPLSLWGQSYVYRLIFVAQDPVATANNLLSNEAIFRTSIVLHLVDTVLFVVMMLLFYRVFKPAGKHLSRLMLAPLLAQLPVVMVMEVFSFTALMILKGEARPTFDVAQQQEAAYLLLRIHSYGAGIGMGKFILGLCFIPFGLLVFRSGLTPRFIGILFIIGGVGYLAECFTSVLLQRADYLMIRTYLMSTTLAWLFAFLWFLIKGANEQKITSN
jgi:hypothetical protein